MSEDIRKPGSQPIDKILCQRRFYRYVVACMHNCQEPHFCKEFWQFFRARGLPPVEYFNEDGIGERAMRRVVFDCDRCGKKELPEVFGLYSLEGEAPEFRLSTQQQSEALEKVGYHSDELTGLTFLVLDSVEQSRDWQHLCKVCFRKISEHLAGVLGNVKPKGTARKSSPPKPEIPAPTVEPAVPPVEPPPELPVPEAPTPSHAAVDRETEERRALPFKGKKPKP